MTTTSTLEIGTGLSIEGRVQCTGHLRVEGTVHGAIEADTVLLGQSGKVVGHIQCHELTIEGWLKGDYTAVDVVVHRTGTVMPYEQAISSGHCRIEGNVWGTVQASVLTVAATGQVNGRIEAERMTVHGVARGEIDVDAFALCRGGIVLGSVHYHQLERDTGSGAIAEFHQKTPKGDQNIRGSTP